MNSLHGIRILDLSRLLPGPYATQLLANLGAEVIKIERPPEGDYARQMPPFCPLRRADTTNTDDAEWVGAIFAQNNIGKKSVALNFDDARGREILLRLAEHADVLIESFRPGAMAQRGLDYASVSAHNPRLIYCSLSGYGQTGPYRQRAGHDLNYLAVAGVLKMNGARDASPVPLPVQVADLAGGMRATLEIVAALVERERTGKGKYLDVALFDAAVDWMQTILGACYRAEGENPERGATHLTGAYPCYNVYETQDGAYMALGALEEKFWRAFCEGIARADLMESQFDADAIPRVAALFKQRTRVAWTEFAQQTDCCLEPLLDVSEALKHPQVVARDLAQGGGAVPRLGEHTRELLGALGMEQAEFQTLQAAEIILE
ncbi:MAG: CoA transferase [Chloroflexi bacterium]|nr:CoA transferase [Chloroflexota bacterium]